MNPGMPHTMCNCRPCGWVYLLRRPALDAASLCLPIHTGCMTIAGAGSNGRKSTVPIAPSCSRKGFNRRAITVVYARPTGESKQFKPNNDEMELSPSSSRGMKVSTSFRLITNKMFFRYFSRTVYPRRTSARAVAPISIKLF
jgi:hypothetical protein